MLVLIKTFLGLPSISLGLRMALEPKHHILIICPASVLSSAFCSI